MRGIFSKLLSVFSPLTATGGVGVCPLCVAASASALTWLGLGALVPIWRPIAFSLLGLGVAGFILDWRKHRNPLPLVLIIAGGGLLYLGRYVWGGPEFSGWPIWGPGAALTVFAVFWNRRLFRAKTHIHKASVIPRGNEECCKVAAPPSVAPDNGGNKQFFTCPECGLKYRERKWAEKCEAWCREHKSCNLEIIKYAVR